MSDEFDKFFQAQNNFKTVELSTTHSIITNINTSQDRQHDAHP